MAHRVLLAATLLLCINFAWGSHANEEELIKYLYKDDYTKFLSPAGTKNPNVTVNGVPYNGTGSPVVVNVNLFVRYIGEINDENKDYKLQLTLRQSWTDERLKYTKQIDGQDYVLLTDPSKIWVPDLFFSNEKEGHDHQLMTANNLIRIGPDGSVMYSTRVSLKLSCPMDFTNFPMDKQTCSVRMASYAHTTKDLIFVWKSEKPVELPQNVDPSPYLLQGIGTDYCFSKTNTGEYSCIKAEFLLKREIFNYLMHAYLPLGLLVLVSWIIFWLDERATGVRVIVAVVTFIATIFEGSRVASLAPHASDTKGIDAWVNWTLFFVFFALVEQVVVILIGTNAISTRKLAAEDEEGGVALPLMENGEKSADAGEVREAAAATTEPPQNLVSKWLSRYKTVARRIDIVARILFPVVFLLFNLTYWSSYADYEGIDTLSTYTKIAYN
ncbi:glutamate-gated chloride channel-like [Neocloeon triangulifer]|uniref:glutamate-gated chloride channel-like n=1 Tax=Neocloeon triangulifer TaxID=2078957 RepID=UPI00286F2CB2|nr:glutamate-gated chloride channel-like [Neocloeon triangulifer]